MLRELADYGEDSVRSAPKLRAKPSESGFARKRRRDGADEVHGVAQAGPGTEGAQSTPTKVKLKRAQGECLGIRSRRRT